VPGAGVVCPALGPAPAEPADPAVWSAAIITGTALAAECPAVGAAAGDELPQWSATLVALATVKAFIVPAAELEFVPGLVPELAVEEVPDVEVFEPMLLPPSCPVTCTSFPISVRTAFKSPVNL
jgi:hypothetical protein